MFESLTRKLGSVFSALSRKKNLTEDNIVEALKDIENALLESDVEFNVVRQFMGDIQQDCIGQNVFKNVTPGQQVVKIVHDRMIEILGGAEIASLSSQKPLKILMVGLHGSGKTTSTVKLAHLLKKMGYSPAVVACDVYRPAAMEQLAILAQQANIPCFIEKNKAVLQIAKSALNWAKEQKFDAVIFDTAGRLQIDTTLIDEVKSMRELIQPEEVLLVADSALGQQAVNVSKTFHEALALTGIVLTKLDGDAKGGAAFSMKRTTGVPIKFAGIGEKIEDFERFYPDRMAGRILGMGDIVSLVEKAKTEVGQEKMEELSGRVLSKDFNFEDFLSQIRQMKKMGPLASITKWLPGVGNLSITPEKEKEFKRIEALILSMTPEERRQPQILTTHRRIRIAKGAGVQISEVNKLLKHFQNMKKTMQHLKKAKPEQLEKLAQSLSGSNWPKEG